MGEHVRVFTVAEDASADAPSDAFSGAPDGSSSSDALLPEDGGSPEPDDAAVHAPSGFVEPADGAVDAADVTDSSMAIHLGSPCEAGSPNLCGRYCCSAGACQDCIR